MDPICQQSIMQAGAVSTMVLGVFYWYRLGPLIKLNYSLTGNCYIQLLDDHLHPFMKLTYPNHNKMIQDDNAECCWVHIICDYFQEHFK